MAGSQGVSVRRAGRGLGTVTALLMVLWLPGALQAQSSFSFDSFVIEGNQRVDPASIVAFTDLPQGQTVTAGQVNDALQRTLASGFFEDVQFEPRGSTLVIRVVERPTISRISIEGNARIDDEALLASLEFGVVPGLFAGCGRSRRPSHRRGL